MVTRPSFPRAESNGNGAIHAHIVGWGMAVPESVLTNADLEAIVETSDEWIMARTGIKTRHIANERESTATLGLKAAQQALDVADVLPAEIDLIVVATSTPEHIFPSCASLIQDRLGANKAGAFDLSAACSGFVYAVNMAAQAIRSGSIRTALVIGSETMSRVMDWQDRSTCILFGDGAGAVVLQGGAEEGGVLSSVLRSDGSGCDLLAIPTVGIRDEASLNGHKMGKMYMAGSEVFKFGTRVIGESITQAAHDAGITVDDLALIVPHQANERILQAAARTLKVDNSVFMSNIERYGNTSAASIPIALYEAVQDGRVREGDYIALVGFGGGLTWAAMIIKWGVPKTREGPPTLIKRHRRYLSYTLARWRARLRRWARWVNDGFNRVRPEAGRVSRLRHKVDRAGFE
jgi:3-oxoacyl-[acyl-carrier-protein] synthase-3